MGGVINVIKNLFSWEENEYEPTIPRINETIIGIDFGTSGLCFAYGYLNDNKEKKCVLGNFEGQNKGQKILNEIILDDKLEKILAFGNDCVSFLCSKHNERFHHFKNIKMNLYNKIYKIKAINSGKEADLKDIITLFLKETKKKAIQQIRLEQTDVGENTRCIVSVPAVWDLKSKQIMLDASIAAGLIKQDDDFTNFFALEPEAASIYFCHENVDKCYKHIGNKQISFILCDFGSGTVDIVTQRRILTDQEEDIKELYHPVGNIYGSRKINDYFIERVIKPLFGEENLNKIKNDLYESNEYEDWVNFENSIEDIKKKFKNINQIEEYFQIDCELFDNENIDIDILESINNFNKNNKWKLKTKKNKYKILFPYQIIYDFTLEITNKAIDLIIPIIQFMRDNNNDINTIILCGGASLSPIIFDILENNPSLKNISILKGKDPAVSIALGSVLYALNPLTISVRKAKYTIGIKCSVKWDNSLHQSGGHKVFYEKDHEYKCDNIFSILVNKDDNFNTNNQFENTFNIRGPRTTIKLYKTEENNVRFCDEKGENGELIIYKFGEYIIDVGNDFDENDNKIIVRVNLGGTFITSSAIYCKTNKQINVILKLE